MGAAPVVQEVTLHTGEASQIHITTRANGKMQVYLNTNPRRYGNQRGDRAAAIEAFLKLHAKLLTSNITK